MGIHGRLSVCENSTLVSDLQKGMENDRAMHAARHASLKERIDMHDSQLTDAVQRHDSHVGKFENSHTRLSSEIKSQADHQALLTQRLSATEGFIGEAARRNTEELKNASYKIDQLYADHQSLLNQHLTKTELAVSEATQRHSQELAGAHAKIDQLQSHVAGEHQAQRQAFGASLESLKNAQEKWASELENRHSSNNTRHATTEQRLDYIEKTSGHTVDEHAKQLLAARNDIQSLHAHLTAEKNAREKHHSTVESRVQSLEESVGTTDWHGRFQN